MVYFEETGQKVNQRPQEKKAHSELSLRELKTVEKME